MGSFLTPLLRNYCTFGVSPIFCVTKHPVILRDTAGRSFTIAPIVKTETPCNVPNYSKKGVLTPFCRIIFFRMRYFPSSVWRSNRRSARRARGLTLTVKNLMKSFYCFFGAFPILGQFLFIGRFRNYLEAVLNLLRNNIIIASRYVPAILNPCLAS